MNTKLITFTSALVCLLLIGCAPQTDPIKEAVDTYFGGSLRGAEPYSVPGVSGYEIRAYEIVSKVGDIVSVKITFAAKAGNDIYRTKKFEVNDGRLTALDEKDIREHVTHALDQILDWGVTLTKKLKEGTGTATWSEYEKDAGPDVMMILKPILDNPPRGVDYTAAVFGLDKNQMLEVRLPFHGETITRSSYDAYLARKDRE